MQSRLLGGPHPSVVFGALVALAACGEPVDPPILFSPSIAWQLDACDQPGELEASMAAVLWIGGHSDCEMTVEPGTLAVSADCGLVTTGIPRTLALVYFLPGTPDTFLAMTVGVVDLSEAALGTEVVEPVVVTVGGDDYIWVFDDTEATALTLLTDEEYDAASAIDKAHDYARARYLESGALFDNDSDGCGNLVEVCGGSALDVANPDDC